MLPSSGCLAICTQRTTHTVSDWTPDHTPPLPPLSLPSPVCHLCCAVVQLVLLLVLVRGGVDLVGSFQPGVGQLLEHEEVHVRVDDGPRVQLVMIRRVVVIVVSGVALRLRQVQVGQAMRGHRRVALLLAGGRHRGAKGERGGERGGREEEGRRLEGVRDSGEEVWQWDGVCSGMGWAPLQIRHASIGAAALSCVFVCSALPLALAFRRPSPPPRSLLSCPADLQLPYLCPAGATCSTPQHLSPLQASSSSLSRSVTTCVHVLQMTRSPCRLHALQY